MKKLLRKAFLDKVRQGRSELRNMSQQELEVIADGRIYTGKQAFDLKLVDELGYLEDAQQQICQLAGTAPKEVSFVKYEKKANVFLDLLKQQSSVETTINKVIQNKFAANFYYLWRPY